MNGLTRVESPPLSQLAYRKLREAIVGGRLRMGQQLVESLLVEQLGVSRAPIREALRRLAEEGLVDDIARRGTFVRTIDLRDFVDVCNTRLALEALSARLIARRRPSVAPLHAALDRMREEAASNARARLVASDLDFHAAVCAASGNAHVSRVFHSLSAQIQMAMAVDEEAREDLGAVIEGHESLVEILQHGGEAEASLAVYEHVLSSMRSSIERLGGDSSELLAPLRVPRDDAGRH